MAAGTGRAVATCCAALLPLLAACPGETRDVATGGTDTVARDASAAGETYEHIARRPSVVVGLAEARGVDAHATQQAVEALADSLEACLARERARAVIAPGAVRLVAYVDAAGAVGPPKITHSGGDAGRIALLCVAAPLRLMTIPPAGDGGAAPPGLAIEASWSP
jgi:hypothetical protein